MSSDPYVPRPKSIGSLEFWRREAARMEAERNDARRLLRLERAEIARFRNLVADPATVECVKEAIQREFRRGPNAWSDESLARAALRAAGGAPND